MTSCFNSYIYFRLGISELDLHLPSPIFLCGLSLHLILKSLSKPKCITLQIIYTLIIFLQKLTWIMSGVHQWKICPWMINYFNRAADRKINTYASVCRIMTRFGSLCELWVMWMLGDGSFRKDACEPDQWSSFFHLKTVVANAVKYFSTVTRIFSWLAKWEMLCSGAFQAS